VPPTYSYNPTGLYSYSRASGEEVTGVKFENLANPQTVTLGTSFLNTLSNHAMLLFLEFAGRTNN